jgi:hypothetical protein
MITTRDPETMTADKRRQEVASILATGLLRRVRTSRTAASDAALESPPESQIGLELPSETRLSVAQQPVG